jgi:hypothetical protein
MDGAVQSIEVFRAAIIEVQYRWAENTPAGCNRHNGFAERRDTQRLDRIAMDTSHGPADRALNLEPDLRRV